MINFVINKIYQKKTKQPLLNNGRQSPHILRIIFKSRFPRGCLFLSGFYLFSFLGRRPKPALLFLIAEKEGKKASTPGSHKIYFYPGILQLPTVGQVKCLYNSVKNKFYRRLQRGALNGNNTANDNSERQKLGGKRRFVLCRSC
ncbi:MAG: hypothetical protein MR993_01260 [Spirochaetes bacterium]|nr:hypothetical protein [Spirochaetota bacterium]